MNTLSLNIVTPNGVYDREDVELAITNDSW